MAAPISPTLPARTSSQAVLSRNIPELDGVRGIAILLVLGFHFGARPPGVPKLFTAVFSLGWSGVDLFFVLSGFLITGILLDTKDAPNYFSSFYARRLLRIAPLYLLWIVAYFNAIVPAARYYGYALPGDGYWEGWYALYLSNWKSAFGPDISWLIPLWSVAVEEQFYLFWPLLVFAVPRARQGYLCGALIVICSALRYSFYNYGVTYPALLDKLTPFRLDTLAFGGLVAVIVRNRTWLKRLEKDLPGLFAAGALGLAAALWWAGTAANTDPRIGTAGFTAFAIVYSLFVFTAYVKAGSSQWTARLLRLPVLRAFGKYSYGIYMLHFPIAIYLTELLNKTANRIPLKFHIVLWAAYKLGGAGLSYAAAQLSWRLIERPFLRLKPYFAAKAAPAR